jgi:heme/copper-type cytochrome/quinol oxidase subunit 2
MIYFILFLGYIVTLIGCGLLRYSADRQMTIKTLIFTITISLIPIAGQVFAVAGICIFMGNAFNKLPDDNILNKKLF